MDDQAKEQKPNQNYIKLDRNLIQVLGLNKAVVLCHLQGIAQCIKAQTNNNTIYQTYNVLEFNLAISRATLIKIIKELEELRLLIKIPNGVQNKNYYQIYQKNYDALLKIIKKQINKKDLKNKKTRNKFKEDVLNLYQEYLKNDITSSINFDTTKKDLINKIINEKIIRSKDIIITNDENKQEFIFKGKQFNHIKDLFSSSLSDEEIKDIIKDYTLQDISILNYFAYMYKRVRGKNHPRITSKEKLATIISDLQQIMWLYGYDDIQVLGDAINEFLTINDKDPTLYLFTSYNSEDKEYHYPRIIMERLK